MVKYVCLSVVLFLGISLQAQHIIFQPVFNSIPIKPNQSVFLPSLGDSILIDDLRFYISDAQFISPDGSINPFSKRHFLCDFQNPESLKLPCPPILSNESGVVLLFQIGIDSTTNSSGALGQDLDPVNGMYWTWNSGYINVKIQGQSPKCPARNHQFEFHLGGYLFPNNALTTFQHRITAGKDIYINIDLKPFFAAIDIQKEFQIMSPSKRTVELSHLFSSCFQLQP